MAYGRAVGLVDRALAAYELEVLDVRALADSFNQVYRVRATQGAFTLRVGPSQVIHAAGSAAAEREWTALLGADAPQVLPTRTGAASVPVHTPGSTESRECMVLSWIPGRPLPRPVGTDDVGDLGELAARLHTAPEPASRRPDGVLDAGQALLFHVPNLLPPRFAESLDRVQAVISALAGSGRPRRLHGDLTPNNVVRSRRGLRALDFQDVMWGHPVQDLAHTVYGLRHDDHDGSLARTFLRRYAKVAPLPDLSALPHLLMGRRLSTANIALARGRSVADVTALHLDAVEQYERSHLG